MVDKKLLSDEDIDTIFDLLTEGKIKEVGEKFRDFDEDEEGIKIWEILDESLKEMVNTIKEIDNIKLMAHIFYSIFFLWAQTNLNQYKIEALEAGRFGSKEYKDRKRELLNDKFEKDMELFTQLMKGMLEELPHP